jgi:hypothetical protein
LISTLGWIDVTSLIVGVAGLGVGVWSIRKVRNARDAEGFARNKLLRRIAADEFRELSATAVNLAGAIGKKDWTDSGRIAIGLIGALAQAKGAWGKRQTDPNDQDQLEATTERIKSISRAIGAAQGGQPDEKQMNFMLSRCVSVIEVVSEIAGKLKYAE